MNHHLEFSFSAAVRNQLLTHLKEELYVAQYYLHNVLFANTSLVTYTDYLCL